MVCTKSHALIPILLTYLTFSAFTWTDLSDLDDPVDSTFVKYKSGHGMATPELMEAHNDDNVVDINSVSLSLSLLLSIINCFQPPHYPCIGSIITWNINRLSSALRSKKGSPLWMEKQTSTGRESAFGRAIRFNSRFMFS